MALIVYNRENSRPQEVTYKGKRTINLDSRGTVYLSKTMSIELGILGGGRVNFAHDDETDDWYICRSDDNEGFIVWKDKRTTAKRNLTAKNPATRMSVAARLPANAVIRPNMPLPTRKRTSPVAKNAVIPRHVAKKTIGNSSFKAITNLKIQNRTSAKKAGQNGHLKRNKQTT